MKRFFLVVTIILLLSTKVYAIPYQMSDFSRVSGPEILTPMFAIGGGQTSIQSYTGFVEILVSGFGQNNVHSPDNFDDAFYHFIGSSNMNTGLFDNTLRVGSEIQIDNIPGGFTWKPNSSLHVEAGSLHVAELAVAYEGDSFFTSGRWPLDVNNGYAPVYSPSHIYHFIIDLNGYDGTLTLGYGDGGTFDNAGSYNITLWQATATPIPEPSTFLLMGTGLIIAVGYQWKKNARRFSTPSQSFNPTRVHFATFGRRR